MVPCRLPSPRSDRRQPCKPRRALPKSVRQGCRVRDRPTGQQRHPRQRLNQGRSNHRRHRIFHLQLPFLPARANRRFAHRRKSPAIQRLQARLLHLQRLLELPPRHRRRRKHRCRLPQDRRHRHRAQRPLPLPKRRPERRPKKARAMPMRLPQPPVGPSGNPDGEFVGGGRCVCGYPDQRLRAPAFPPTTTGLE